MSATTQVKVLSPEIKRIALGQGLHALEARTDGSAKGELSHGVPGSESVAGKRTVCIGTWENRSVPRRSPREAEEAGRGYGASVVGPTRSRERDGVTSVEAVGPPEGVGSSTERDGGLTC